MAQLWTSCNRALNLGQSVELLVDPQIERRQHISYVGIRNRKDHSKGQWQYIHLPSK